MGPSPGQACTAVRVLILTGHGLNCEAETAQAFRMCGAHADLVHLSDVLEARSDRGVLDYQLLAMVGGFSFGDHLGAGVVYANRLRHRLSDSLQAFAGNGGLILGICNGFQVMVQLGLLPGFDGDYRTQRATLGPNERAGYRDAWVRLRAESASRCVWTRGIDTIDLPSRHGQGRLLVEDEAQMERLESEGLVAVRYVDAQGKPTQRWPENPSGSTHAVAGLCDPSGRLFGLMPHPEGFLYGFHHPLWQRRKLDGTLSALGDGLRIFRNGVDYAARRCRPSGGAQGAAPADQRSGLCAPRPATDQGDPIDRTAHRLHANPL
jgi:phosphoribosylformylglycinamidine synthase subunit PurQ / glutaminase